MIHLRYASGGPTYCIVSVSSEELNDRELLDEIMGLSRERKTSLTMHEIEIVMQDGRRRGLEVLDLGFGSLRALTFLGHLRKRYPVQIDRFEYNERWHSPDLISEPLSLHEWPEWLQSVFRTLLTDLREWFLSGHISIGTITRVCEFSDMAARWSPYCLKEAVALLVGAILPSQPFHVHDYLTKIGIDANRQSRFLMLAQHASNRAAEWSLDSNVLSWHACAQAMISKGWHQHFESLSSIGENVKEITKSYGRWVSRETPQPLSWLVDPIRDRILRYATDPRIELDEFLDLAYQEEPAGFRLVRRLSIRSAFKNVYLADDQMGRSVVLKRYKSSHTKPMQVLMERLATSPEKMLSKDTVTNWLGLIRHSNIQPCMLVRTASGEPLILEPLLEHTLDEFIDNSDFEARELVKVLRGIVDAVAYLHERGLIHADIKPDNIGIAGSVGILLDFGISTFDPQVPRGNPGSIKTRAPELFSHAAIPTNASDIWALGATVMAVMSQGEYPVVSKEEVHLMADMGQEQRQAFEHSLQQRARAYQNDPSKLRARLFRTLQPVPDSIRNIVYSACNISPTERPSARELLRIFDVAVDTPN
jgi:hypothetical protein